MTDPLKKYEHGGNPQEMETVLGYLKTEDDLRQKVLESSAKELVSEDCSEGSDSRRQPWTTKKEVREAAATATTNATAAAANAAAAAKRHPWQSRHGGRVRGGPAAFRTRIWCTIYFRVRPSPRR